MALEVEVKLTGRPSELAAAFADLRGARPTRRHLLSTYYDTPDRRLRDGGFALRVRERDGDRELTLKQDRGDGLTRGEWNVPLPASRDQTAPPDLNLLPGRAPIAALGLDDGPGLEPAFLTDFERRTKDVRIGDAVVEVALDVGHIVAGERHAPIAELEFELLDGPVSDLLAGVRSVLDERRLSLGTRSKAARGMDLSNGVAPSAVKAKSANLDASDTVDEALAKVCRVTSMQALGNLAPIIDAADPTGVHQLRVALRRLRSALLFFRDHSGARAKRLHKEARRALRRLGPARDLDVFLIETLPPVIAAHPGEGGLGRLREAAAARRAEAHADARRLIESRRFNRFLIDLMEAAATGGLATAADGRTVEAGGRAAEVDGRAAGRAEAPLLSVARERLALSHRRLMKRARGFERLTPDERHAVRIALKKLRYACAYARGLFPGPETRAYLTRLSDLQDALGRLNDGAVARQISRQLAAYDPDAAPGAALVGEMCLEWERAAEPALLTAWRDFAEVTPFWQEPPSEGPATPA